MTTRPAWKAALFPEPERDLPAERWVRIGLRTAHLACMAVLVGGHAFDVGPERLHTALVLTVITGVLFALLEMFGTLNWLFELRGVATLVKIGLLGLIPIFWEARLPILFTVLVIGAVSSHMTARLRYYSVLTGAQARHRRG